MVAEDSIQTKKRIRKDETQETTTIPNDDVTTNPSIIPPDDGKSVDNDSEMEFVDENVSSSTRNVEHPAKECSSSAKSTTGVFIQEKTQNNEAKETLFSKELMAQYYTRFFPYHLLYSWLSYTPKVNTSGPSKVNNNSMNKDSEIFTHREFSFTVEPSPGDEIYIRYQSFSTVEELRSAIIKRNPLKIDIGAVFSHPPKDHHSLQSSRSDWCKFRPRQRELVFDIDLTDYDGVRNCGCSGADICKVCWKMMGMAVKVMDQGLREDFGFRHIAWFYSGRRGVHAWVCDEEARDLSDEGRSAVASYFEMNLEDEKKLGVDLQIPLHPSFERSYKILEPYFLRDIISESGHGILATPSTWKNLLSTLPMPAASSVVETLTRKWDGDDSTPEEKWEELKRYLDILLGKRGGNGGGPKRLKKQTKKMDLNDERRVELWPIATVFRYTYPRLDINVSKSQNHLLKSPFCVHPKTGRVCVPINPQEIDDFDPFSVPTLPRLMRELDNYEDDVTGGSDDECKKEKNGKPEWSWEKTSLLKPFKFFEQDFLLPLCNDLKRIERSKAEEMGASIGDF